MATKRVCDRCGADINPNNSATYIDVTNAYHERTAAAELCVSCGMQIREWLKLVEIPALSRKEADHA